MQLTNVFYTLHHICLLIAMLVSISPADAGMYSQARMQQLESQSTDSLWQSEDQNKELGGRLHATDTLRREPRCSGHTILTDSSGTFTHGPVGSNYAPHMRCSWMIARPGEYITISFTKFRTYEKYDFVQVEECESQDCTSPTSLARLYETPEYTGPFTSTSGFMRVTFITDWAVEHGGFTAEYFSEPLANHCAGDEILTDSSGSFAHGHGSNYAPNRQCSWMIVRPGEFVRVAFSNFRTADHRDFVEVEECESQDCASPRSLASLSGAVESAGPFVSMSGFLRVTFTTTSHALKAGGFTAQYLSTRFTKICPAYRHQSTCLHPGWNPDGDDVRLRVDSDNDDFLWGVERNSPNGPWLIWSLAYPEYNLHIGGDYHDVRLWKGGGSELAVTERGEADGQPLYSLAPSSNSHPHSGNFLHVHQTGIWWSEPFMYWDLDQGSYWKLEPVF